MTAGRFLHPALEALAAAALGLIVVAGAAFVWIGVPLLGLWLAGEMTATPPRFLLVALVVIPTAMAGFGWLLYRLNRVYEGLRAQERSAGDGHAPWLRSFSDEGSRARRKRAPRALIDVAMTVSAWAALVLMAVWFFFFAEFRLVSW